VQLLLDKTLDRFGAVHVLINNAGVGRVQDFLRPAWECPLEDWEQILAVNLWGVIHGMRVFVPQMLKQNDECYVVNVASIGGLVVPNAGNVAYSVSKFGVVALSEGLFTGLSKRGANVGVALICPGGVSTDIVGNAIRSWEGSSGEAFLDLPAEDRDALLRHNEGIKNGIPPEEVAEKLFRAMRENRFYVLTHPETKERIRKRMEDILDERNPARAASG
jgi:NAD(P)-dependent dehydrogenase (short-subunit alcohol dehydrogenase family)